MGLARLVALASAMFLATLLAAAAPLLVRLSPKRVQAVSELSVGILVGAALAIILPEGVAAVYGNSSGPAHHDDGAGDSHGENAGWIGGALLSGFLLMYIIDSVHGHDEYPDPDPQPHLHPRHRHAHRPHFHPTPSHLAELEPLSSGAGRNSNEYTPAAHAHDLPEDGEAVRWDDAGGSSGATSGSRSPLRCNDAHLITADASSISTVIGMLVHSLADGISLGASSVPLSTAAARTLLGGASEGDGTSSPLQLIVFLVIMMHKAPTAFALSTLLSSSPATSKAFTRRALLLFALAAPAGALGTYAVLSLLGAHGGAGSRAGWWTGLALVFSGGTFLFVATHAVREQETRAEGRHREGAEGSERLGEKQRLALVLAGMLTPAVLSRLIGHEH